MLDHKANTVLNVAGIAIVPPLVAWPIFAFPDTTTYIKDHSIHKSANQQMFKCQKDLASEMTCASPEHAIKALDFLEI